MTAAATTATATIAARRRGHRPGPWPRPRLTMSFMIPHRQQLTGRCPRRYDGTASTASQRRRTEAPPLLVRAARRAGQTRPASAASGDGVIHPDNLRRPGVSGVPADDTRTAGSPQDQALAIRGRARSAERMSTHDPIAGVIPSRPLPASDGRPAESALIRSPTDRWPVSAQISRIWATLSGSEPDSVGVQIGGW